MMIYFNSPSGCVLPVELGQFSATPESNGSVRVSWTTLSEQNSESFFVERSPDGISFSQVMEVPAMQQSSAPVDYEIVDYSPIGGTSFYRLRQTDLDGTEKILDMVAVTVEIPASYDITLYPNPASSEVNILSTNGMELGRVMVMDLSGRILIDKKCDPGSGSDLGINVSALERGMYLIKTENQFNQASYHRVILQ